MQSLRRGGGGWVGKDEGVGTRVGWGRGGEGAGEAVAAVEAGERKGLNIPLGANRHGRVHVHRHGIGIGSQFHLER